ncbi:MAG: hypothetical protein PG981_000576 [Wolbachia endosymbiont of Ctenocephalides orientis wCori]|nr:MAG: hypothetical protein PG981_000576 [Wolbachia endosymbiont of Ctenocephalides orientis wCori]
MISNFLGIDISKERFDVFLSFVSTKGKRKTRKRSFKNDDNGFQGLLDFLQKHNVEEVRACRKLLTATVKLWLNFYTMLDILLV